MAFSKPFSYFFVLGILISGCQGNLAKDALDKTTRTTTSPVNFPEVDFDKAITATRPWKIVFVSQDGPKGHENIAATNCPGVVWCHMWQLAEQAGQELGVDLELAYVKEDCTNENQCVRQQIELLNDLIAQGGIDGIIIGPRESNQLVPVVEKAIAANIAVIALATPINSPQVLTLVTFNDFEGGKSIGKWVSERLQGKGNVLILEGPKYQKNALDRRHGFIAGLQKTDITVLDTATALWTCENAQMVTQKWLTKFPDVDAIIAASDHMALGALIATTAANRSNILITGYDAIPQAQAAIAAGALGATIEQVQLINSPTAVKLLVRHLETGETFPPIVYLSDLTLISSENIQRKSDSMALTFDAKTLTCKF